MRSARPILLGALLLLVPLAPAPLAGQDSDTRTSVYVGLASARPSRGLDDTYHSGWGLDASALRQTGHLAFTGAFAWTRFPAEPPPAEEAGALRISDLEVYSATAGVRWYLGPAHLGAEGGYFWSKSGGVGDEWDAMVGVGTIIGPLDVTARYKPFGEAGWFSLTAALEIYRLYTEEI